MGRRCGGDAVLAGIYLVLIADPDVSLRQLHPVPFLVVRRDRKQWGGVLETLPRRHIRPASDSLNIDPLLIRELSCGQAPSTVIDSSQERGLAQRSRSSAQHIPSARWSARPGRRVRLPLPRAPLSPAAIATRARLAEIGTQMAESGPWMPQSGDVGADSVRGGQAKGHRRTGGLSPSSTSDR